MTKEKTLKEILNCEELPKRCTKCNAPFLLHHHKHIIGEEIYHTNCFKNLPNKGDETKIISDEACRKLIDYASKQPTKTYQICEECGATDSCKTVEWAEYRKIKKEKGLIGVNLSKKDNWEEELIRLASLVGTDAKNPEEKLKDFISSLLKKQKSDIEETIIEVLTDTEFYAGKDHYVETVIKEAEPFFWRINKKWAKETAQDIINKIKEK